MRQIEEDVDALEVVMDRLGVKADRVEEAIGWTSEKLRRLELNGQLLGYRRSAVGRAGGRCSISGRERRCGSPFGSVPADDPRLGVRASSSSSGVHGKQRRAASAAAAGAREAST